MSVTEMGTKFGPCLTIKREGEKKKKKSLHLIFCSPWPAAGAKQHLCTNINIFCHLMASVYVMELLISLGRGDKEQLVPAQGWYQAHRQN